jgi:hypothetical protein
MSAHMRYMDEKDFAELVQSHLSDIGVEWESVEGTRRSTSLDGALFYDFQRLSHLHKPDFRLRHESEGLIPAEVKSTQEMYMQCRYSKAHLLSYLLQIIYGQCLSYADLYRENADSERLSIYLFLPGDLTNKTGEYVGDLESVFAQAVLTDDCLHAEIMGVKAGFSVPDFCASRSRCGRYGRIKLAEGCILCARIEYSLRVN